MHLPAGGVLEKRYQIENLIAHGGMGAIYRAFDTNLKIPVAIKENFFTTPQAIEQFKQEALILARLRHTSLPRVLQHFSQEGRQYLVMEFIEGVNLWEQIKSQGKNFSEEKALLWIDRVCDAVAYLHSQTPPIIHRDIKPQNIKLMPDGQVILVDFGVAKKGSVEAITATGARGVTPGFSPPEQYSGGGSSPASDIYALGATLYAFLTGVRPPDSVSLAIGAAEYIPPNQYNPNISNEAVEAIDWAMQINPKDRPQRVDEWRQSLPGITSKNYSYLSEKELLGLDGIKEEIIAQTDQESEPPDALEPIQPDEYIQDQKLQIEDADVHPKSESLKRICPQCSFENPSEMRFCENCGSKLLAVGSTAEKKMHEKEDAELICKRCSSKNPSEMRFCEECGHRLN
ncbi:MAG: serine/threonine-protein kinase [Anaerolineaceae bacterium]|nr:serine/threonine-protein kinase [Anaerolineaceae bacterium]